MKSDSWFRYFAIGSTWFWLCTFSLFAFLLMLLASLMRQDQEHILFLPFTFTNYVLTFSKLYLTIFWRSFYLAGFCTLLCLILAYPFAFMMAKAEQGLREIMMILLIIPFWTSSLIRSYAMVSLIKTKGLINTALLSLGLIHQPLQLLYTNTAVMIGLVYNLLPFMILPLYANIERLDMRLVEAARDLGANRITILKRILVPLTMPGIVAGCILVLLPAMTLFYIPDLLGGAKSMLLGNLIEYEFLNAHNWPQGAAISMVLTILMGCMLLLYKFLNPDSSHSEDFV